MNSSANYLIFLFLFLLCSCDPDPPSLREDGEVNGLAPIYISEDSLANIEALSPQSVSQPGPMSNWNDFLFIRDGREGYHLINTADPENVTNEAFWQIPGTSQLQIVGDRAYLDNFHFLLIVDLSAAPELKIISRNPVVELKPYLLFPRYHQGYYECHNPDSGVVLEWRHKTELQEPLCYNQEL